MNNTLYLHYYSLLLLLLLHEVLRLWARNGRHM